MTQHFGEHIGQLLHFHGDLETSYKTHNIWPDGRQKDDADLGEGEEGREARGNITNLMKTTS